MYNYHNLFKITVIAVDRNNLVLSLIGRKNKHVSNLNTEIYAQIVIKHKEFLFALQFFRILELNLIRISGSV